MKRWLFNFAATACLSLSVATAALWVRSYFRYDKFTVTQVTARAEKLVDTDLLVESEGGRLLLWIGREHVPREVRSEQRGRYRSYDYSSHDSPRQAPTRVASLLA